MQTRYLKHSHAQSGLHLYRHYYLNNSYTFSLTLARARAASEGQRGRERKPSYTEGRKLLLNELLIQNNRSLSLSLFPRHGQAQLPR